MNDGARHEGGPHTETGRDPRAGGPSGGGGVRRRAFLGTAAVGAAGAVGAAMAVTGCASSSSPGARGTAGPSAPGAGPAAVAERDRPGDPGWRIRSQGPPEAIEGYPDRISVLPGEPFGLHVSTTAPGFTVSAYRIGWYGGAQARLVWRSGRVPGERQAPARVIPSTRSVRADWRRSLEVPTTDWPAGAYLLRLDGEHGHQRYVPFVVRSAAGAGATVIMHSVATWQAYNTWGGHDLYQGPDGGYGTRSLEVSFDRPYGDDGAEKFMVYERALVVLAERLGIPLAYTTGVDVHLAPDVLRGAASVISLGHDEYWTPEQRRYVEQARDAGTNVAFLGANTCFRRIRFETGPSGAVRTVACYKTSFRDDPYFAAHRDMPTNDFRQEPAAAPESSLTGVIYEGYPTDAPYVVLNPDHWLFAGTGVKRGDSFDHLVGVEYDRVTPEYPTPRPLEIVAHSPLVCQGRASHADTAYYTVPGGAGVFASGTMRWVEALMGGTRENGRNHDLDARTAAFVTRTTENLLRAFAAGPAGRTRPAPNDNVREVYT